jgi:hypothetical protein
MALTDKMKKDYGNRSLELHLIGKHNMMGLYWNDINDPLGYTRDMPANKNYWVWKAFMHEEGDSELILSTYPVSDYLFEFKKGMPKSLRPDSVGNLVLGCTKKGQGLDEMYWLAQGLVSAILEEKHPKNHISIPEGKFILCVDHIKKRRLKVETQSYLKESPGFSFD